MLFSVEESEVTKIDEKAEDKVDDSTAPLSALALFLL